MKNDMKQISGIDNILVTFPNKCGSFHINDLSLVSKQIHQLSNLDMLNDYSCSQHKIILISTLPTPNHFSLTHPLWTNPLAAAGVDVQIQNEYTAGKFHIILMESIALRMKLIPL
jgi:hypothetical protein